MLTKKEPSSSPLQEEQSKAATTTKTSKSPKASTKSTPEACTDTCSKTPLFDKAGADPQIQYTTTTKKKGPYTKVTIKFDVGFSNAIFIRGKGANLNWEKGATLKNVKADEWVWETDQSFATCEFKVLINDREYETGPNHTLTCGASIQYTPKFPSR